MIYVFLILSKKHCHAKRYKIMFFITMILPAVSAMADVIYSIASDAILKIYPCRELIPEIADLRLIDGT